MENISSKSCDASIVPLWPTSSFSFSFSRSFKEGSHGRAIDRQPPWSQNLFQQQTDTLWEIKHGGILSQWNHYIPPTLFSCTVGESQWERQHEKEPRLSVGLFRSEGARLIGRARTQRASERALVIWSVRQLGLSSETQRGEVGDHVWGPPSCYCP